MVFLVQLEKFLWFPWEQVLSATHAETVCSCLRIGRSAPPRQRREETAWPTPGSRQSAGPKRSRNASFRYGRREMGCFSIGGIPFRTGSVRLRVKGSSSHPSRGAHGEQNHCR